MTLSTDSFVVEINDAGLLLVGPDEVHPPSPGVAVWDGENLFVGPEAWRRCRRLPRDSDDQFWDRLSQESMDRPVGPAVSSADLAHRHLSQVWAGAGRQAERVLLSVTGAMEERQVALLLGIARSIGIPVVAVVDAGLAAATASPKGYSSVVHVDAQLHRAVVTRVELGHEWTRSRVALVNPFGLKSLTDRWLRFLAEAFVRTTRFDPLDRGEYEQQLLDRLPACLEALQKEASVSFEFEAHDRRHAVVVKRDELMQVAQSSYQQLVREIADLCGSDPNPLVQLSPRLALLPGLLDLVRREIAADVIELAPGSASQALLSLDAGWPSRDAAVSFVTRLDARPGSMGSPSPPEPQGPAHLVGEGEPIPLVADPVYFVATDPPHRVEIRKTQPGDDLASFSVAAGPAGFWLESRGEPGVYLNGLRIKGRRALRINDCIRIAGTLEEFKLVPGEVSDGA